VAPTPAAGAGIPLIELSIEEHLQDLPRAGKPSAIIDRHRHWLSKPNMRSAPTNLRQPNPRLNSAEMHQNAQEVLQVGERRSAVEGEVACSSCQVNAVSKSLGRPGGSRPRCRSPGPVSRTWW